MVIVKILVLKQLNLFKFLTTRFIYFKYPKFLIKDTYTPNNIAYFIKRLSNKMNISSCLVISSTLFIFLKSIDLNPRLMIGVNKDLKNRFSSHAWIELNDLIFYENIEKFKVIKEIN